MLYIVSTPIGNLKDITLRAIEILQSVDLIAAEDTRRAQILLKTYNIKKPLTSYYSYNKVRRAPHLIRALQQGESIALISDSGTPGISDPGVHLIQQAIKHGVAFTSIPGPTALITALILSGKPTNRFVFEGFLPAKPGPRRRRLKDLATEQRTVIIYESCYRMSSIRFPGPVQGRLSPHHLTLPLPLQQEQH